MIVSGGEYRRSLDPKEHLPALDRVAPSQIPQGRLCGKDRLSPQGFILKTPVMWMNRWTLYPYFGNNKDIYTQKRAIS